MAHTCNSSTLGGRGGRIGQGQEIETILANMARSFTPVIPVLWEAKVGRSRGEEIETILANTGFETSLANMVKPSLVEIQNISWAWWWMPVIPVTQEVEAGESFEPRRQRLQHCSVLDLSENCEFMAQRGEEARISESLPLFGNEEM
ncbi:NANOG neighbor homeobox [Plecturocebus cupreus]